MASSAKAPAKSGLVKKLPPTVSVVDAGNVKHTVYGVLSVFHDEGKKWAESCKVAPRPLSAEAGEEVTHVLCV